MKCKKMAALLMAATLVTSLVGCGERAGIANDNDILGDESGYSSQNLGSLFGSNDNDSAGKGGSKSGSGKSGSINGGNGMQNGSGSMTGGNSGTIGGTSGMNGGTNGIYNQNRTNGGVSNYSTVNPASGMAMHTATWRQMVQNGCVHDRDGFLLDGENTTW